MAIKVSKPEINIREELASLKIDAQLGDDMVGAKEINELSDATTEGTDNVGLGAGALSSPLLTGSNNTATGRSALINNISGGSNTATGVDALYSNTTGNRNSANGYQAGYNSKLSNNTYLGSYVGTATDADSIFLSAGSALYQTISTPVAEGGVPVMSLVVETDEETGEILKQVRVVDENLMRDKIADAVEPLVTKIKELEKKLKTLGEKKGGKK